MTERNITSSVLARGLGPAGHGASHWWTQRVTAAALVPLALWLAVALASGTAMDHAALTTWLETPVHTVLIILLIAAFHHAALGFQVVIEDYLHSPARFIAVGIIKLLSIAGAVAGIVAVLCIALLG